MYNCRGAGQNEYGNMIINYSTWGKKEMVVQVEVHSLFTIIHSMI